MILDFFNNNFIINPIHNTPSILNTQNTVVTIGTSNIDPNHILNVKGDLFIDGDINITKNINNDTLYANAIHQHNPEDLNSNVALTFDNSGKLGIHANPPNFPLDVNGSINASAFNINGKTLTQKVEELAPKGVNVDIYEISYYAPISEYTFEYKFASSTSSPAANVTFTFHNEYSIDIETSIQNLLNNYDSETFQSHADSQPVARHNINNGLISKKKIIKVYRYKFYVDPTATKTFWLIFHSNNTSLIQSFGIDGSISNNPTILNYLSPNVFDIHSYTTNISNPGYSFDINSLKYVINTYSNYIALETLEDIGPIVAIRFSSYTP